MWLQEATGRRQKHNGNITIRMPKERNTTKILSKETSKTKMTPTESALTKEEVSLFRELTGTKLSDTAIQFSMYVTERANVEKGQKASQQDLGKWFDKFHLKALSEQAKEKDIIAE